MEKKNLFECETVEDVKSCFIEMTLATQGAMGKSEDNIVFAIEDVFSNAEDYEDANTLGESDWEYAWYELNDITVEVKSTKGNNEIRMVFDNVPVHIHSSKDTGKILVTVLDRKGSIVIKIGKKTYKMKLSNPISPSQLFLNKGMETSNLHSKDNIKEIAEFILQQFATDSYAR